jgi:hypothetical protein
VEEHGACCGELAWSEGGERIGDGISHHGEEVLAAERSGGGRGREGRVTAGRGKGLLHLEVVEACGFDGEMVGRLPAARVWPKAATSGANSGTRCPDCTPPWQAASRTG